MLRASFALIALLFVPVLTRAADNWRELTTVKGTVVSGINADEFLVEHKGGLKAYPLHKLARNVQVDSDVLLKLEKKRDLVTLEKYARIHPSQLPPGAKVEVFWHDTHLTKDGQLIQNLDYFQVRLLKLLDEDKQD